MSGKGTIAVDPDALKREAERIGRVADDMQRALKDARRAVGRPGLPPYARQTEAGVEGVQRNIDQLRLAAGVLSTRCVLAYMAESPGMDMFKRKLEGFERVHFAKFNAALVSASVNYAVEEALGKGSKGIVGALVKALESHHIRLTPKQVARVRRNLELSDAKFHRQYKSMSKLGVRSMLALDTGLAAAARNLPNLETQLRSGWLERRIGLGGFGMAIDGFSQWLEDRDETMSREQRVGRIGVNVAVGGGVGTFVAAAVGGLTAVTICAGSAGVGCTVVVPVAATLIGGTAGNMAASEVNARLLPIGDEKAQSQQAKRAREIAANFRKLEQWYIEHARPAPDWLQGRLEGTKVQTEDLGDGRKFQTFIRRFDGHVVAERQILADGRSATVYYDEYGDPIER